MAPLMMTLVRKGKATSFAYHQVYANSLYLGYVMVSVRLLNNTSSSAAAIHAQLSQYQIT
jgi:hypothetical protein